MNLNFVFINHIDSVIGFLKIKYQKDRQNREYLTAKIYELEQKKIDLALNSDVSDKIFTSSFSLITDVETDFHTTAFVLHQFYTLISQGIFDSETGMNYQIISALIESVNSTKFTSQRTSMDELVIFEIIEIFKICLMRRIFSHLSDYHVFSCLQTTLSIFLDNRFNDLINVNASKTLSIFLTFMLNEELIESCENIFILDFCKLPNRKKNIFSLTKYELSTSENNSSPGSNSDISNNSNIHKNKKFVVPVFHEYLRFLISLSNPKNKNKIDYIEFSLSQIYIALQFGLEQLISVKCLFDLIRFIFCPFLNELLFHDSIIIFHKSLLILNQFIKVSRSYLKNEIEILLTSVLKLATYKSSKQSERSELILDFMMNILSDKIFMLQLYLNYDTQVLCDNIFNLLIEVSVHYITVEMSSKVLDAVLNFLIFLDNDYFEYNRQYFNDALRYKIKYDAGIEIVNDNFSKGIEYWISNHVLPPEDYEATLAKFMKYDARISRKIVGEKIGDRKKPKILEEYIKLFKIENVEIEPSLRDFLENFRIPGESPVITIIIEKFSEVYLSKNKTVFANIDAIFTLCYAIIMLNVDQHNATVKQQKSMTMEDFLNNLKGVNAGQDFPAILLKNIYTSIHSNEFKVPIEHSGLVKRTYLWKLAAEKSIHYPSVYFDATKPCMHKEIFHVIVFHMLKIIKPLLNNRNFSLDLVIKTYHYMMKISSKLENFNIIDQLIIELLISSKLIRSNLDINSFSVESIIMEISTDLLCQRCLIEAFKQTYFHNNHLTVSWRYILACIANLTASELLPTKLYEFEDFVESSALYFLQIGDKLNKRKDSEASSFLNSFVQLITSDSSEYSTSDEYFRHSREIVAKCNIDLIFENLKSIKNESFVELCQSLILFSELNPPTIPFEIKNSDNGVITFLTSTAISTFFVDLLVVFCLSNKSRIEFVIHDVLDVFIKRTIKSNNFSIFTRRSIDGLLRLSIRLIDVSENVSKMLLMSLRKLLTNPSLLHRYSVSIVFGLNQLICSRFSFIKSGWDWVCLLEIIEIAGCGRNSLLTSVTIYPDILEDSQQETSANTTINDISMSEIYQQKALYDAIDDGGKDFFNFKKSFVEFENSASSKSIQLLSYMVSRKSSNLSHINILPCVHALTTFSERIFFLLQTNQKNNDKSEKNILEEELESKILESHAIKLLELMFSMFCLSSCVMFTYIKSLPYETLSIEECSSFLWHSSWYHLLKRMAIFVIDQRRNVRQTCLLYIEQALRINDIQSMLVNEWFLCIDRILIQMLRIFVKHPPSVNSFELDETRTRSLALFTKLFLFKVNELHLHPSFLHLWISIIDCFGLYKKIQDSDVLQEALPEYLKNMLSVMQTTGVIDINNNSPSSLWIITKNKLLEYFSEFDLSFLSQNSKYNSTQIITPNPKIPISSHEFTLEHKNTHTESESSTKPTVSIPEFKIITSEKKFENY